MSFGIAVKALDFAGGAQIGGHATPWTVEGQTIVCLGDPVTPHEPGPPHMPDPRMAEGSSWFTVDGIPVCREGHLATCLHATTGRAWWTLPE